MTVATAFMLVPCMRSAQAGCTLRTQWEWVGSVRSPAYPVPLATPLVVQLTDDDGDGRIGPGDVPDVVFTHMMADTGYPMGVITALNGRDGSEIFTTVATVKASLAAGDLDGDGVVEIVGFSEDAYSLVAFRQDGSMAWRRRFSFNVHSYATLGIADVDSDGSPEIYFNAALHSADGWMRWQGARARGLWGCTNVAVDLLPGNPGLEIIASNICYASDGTVLWDRSDLPESSASVGDLDGDGTAEVVLSGLNRDRSLNYIELHVLDRGGTELGSLINLNLTNLSPAPATLADLDGDGRLEVIVPMGASLDAYMWTGATLETKWSIPLIDGSGCCGGASVFDLDGDGVPEVLYRGSLGFYVIDGRNGAVLDSRLSPSVTLFELPVVADIDNDGMPEIVVTGGGLDTGGWVTAYECGVPVPTRCIWNQQAYHVTNVNDDGTIPRVEVPPWTVGLGWLEQEARGCCESITPPLPDVTLCAGEATTLDASSIADPGCPGGSTFVWRDELGTVIGTSVTVLVSPASSTTYEVTVDCPGQPTCALPNMKTVRVTVDLPALFSILNARDPDPCNLGLELMWDAATFRDPSGTGSYNVYRSEASCADAMTLPPVATGVTTLRWVDTSTRAGSSYYYAIQAEDARTTTPCPQGPNNGGAVNAGIVCLGPILEAPDAYTPDLLGWALRASHIGDVVTMLWPGSRPLLPGEHYHVLKSYDPSGFSMVNAEAALSLTWTETDVSRRLQFFDIRIANNCEILSLDDEPAGWDVPHP